MRMVVGREIAEPLIERHGGRMYVVSQRDWNAIRRTLKKFPRAYAACKKLDVRMTPLVVRHGEEIVRAPRRKRK